MEDIGQYIELVKKEFYQYMLIIFEYNFDKNVFDIYMNEYIDIRYFNKKLNINEKKDLYKAVLDHLEEVSVKLLRTFKEEQVLNIKEAFKYIIYWDNIGKYDKNENIVNKIIEFRKEKLKLKKEVSFSKKILKEMAYRKELKENYIKNFFGEEFKIRNKKTNKNSISFTELTYNIPFPNSISPRKIKEVFNTGTTAEDKLVIEYHIINSMLIQDIIRGDFYKQYIVDFAITLLNKRSKLVKVLKIISNEFQQERINLLIDYKEITQENKTALYSLMRQGYKIAVKLDESFTFEETKIRKLNVFSYIVVTGEKEYKKLEKYKEISKKIIKV